MNSVSPGSRSLRRLGEIGAVDVGDEAERHRPIAERPQRAIGHLRPEIGAADADVDHIADTLAGMAAPRAAAHAFGRNPPCVQDGWTSGTTSWPSTRIRASRGARSATCRTARCSVDVDLLAAEHRVAPFDHTAFVGKLQQQPDRLVGDAVLRVVQDTARRLRREALATARVVGEQLPQRHALDL